MRVQNEFGFLTLFAISLFPIIVSQYIEEDMPPDDAIRYYDVEEDPGGDFLDAVQSPWFVDKTPMIEEFVKFNYIQVTAPHRFGKSTNLSMLRYFFDITLSEGDGFTIKRKQNTEYYKIFTDRKLNLSISTNKYMIDKYLGEFIVIYFSLNRILGKTLKEKVKELHRMLQEQVFEKYAKWFDHQRDQLYYQDKRKAIVLEKLFTGVDVCDADIKVGLSYLVESLKNYYHKEVILLVDEFDSPAMNSLLMNEDPYPITRVIHTMICGVLKTTVPECRVYRALFTGIYSSTALTCGSSLLNSVINLPFLRNHEFVKFYGFLPQEVDELFKRNNIPDDDESRNVTRFYKGYLLENSPAQMIYNPIPILRYLEERLNGTPATFESCCMKRGPVLEIMEEAMSHYSLREIILKLWQGKTMQMYPLTYDVMEYKKLLKAVFNKEHVFLNFIFHNGYLSNSGTVNSYKIPNSDIRREFEYAIRSFYKGNNVNLELVGTQLHDILNYNRTLSRAEKNHVRNVFEEEFRKFISNIKRSRIRIDEKEISSFFYVASLLVPSKNVIEKEFRTVKIKNDELNDYFGRIDLMLVDHFNVTALIVEFKYKGVLRSALNQAERYKITHRFPVKNIFFIAISIDKKLNVKLDVKFVSNATNINSDSFQYTKTVRGTHYRRIRGRASMIRYYKKIRTTRCYDENDDQTNATRSRRVKVDNNTVGKIIKKIGTLYYCPFCDYNFNRKYNVKDHILTLHVNSSKAVLPQAVVDASEHDISASE